jgi:hypothetical protein
VKKRLSIFFIGFITFLFWGNIPVGSLAKEGHHGEAKHGEEDHHHAHHEAHHAGVLNVIGKERGHIEIRLEEDTLEAWFVGGGQDTHRSVPVKASEIPLKVILPEQGEKTLVLKTDPMKLAGEKVGRCSHFIAKADWLREVKHFEARGEVEFQGFAHVLLIKYPEGYDPLHGHETK